MSKSLSLPRYQLERSPINSPAVGKLIRKLVESGDELSIIRDGKPTPILSIKATIELASKLEGDDGSKGGYALLSRSGGEMTYLRRLGTRIDRILAKVVMSRKPLDTKWFAPPPRQVRFYSERHHLSFSRAELSYLEDVQAALQKQLGRRVPKTQVIIGCINAWVAGAI